MNKEQDITRLLQAWRAGDAAALEDLMATSYDYLHQMAARNMAQENVGHTWQPTALVHEAFMRIIQIELDWQDRAHFYGVMGNAMRRCLVDHARSRRRQKRGDGKRALSLDDMLTIPASDDSVVLELHQALHDLGQQDQRKEKVVELRYFAGLENREIAEVLNISTPTVERDLRMAKAWLQRALSDDAD